MGIINLLKDNFAIAYNKVKLFFAPLKGIVTDTCKLVSNIIGALARDAYVLGAKAANIVRDIKNKPAQSINLSTADKIETKTVEVIDTVLKVVIDVIFTGLELLCTIVLLQYFYFEYITEDKSYEASKSVQYFIEAVIEEQQEVETITESINETVIEAKVIAIEEETIEVVEDIDNIIEEELNNDEIEITNMESFLYAIEAHLADNAAQAVGIKTKTIEYNAKPGKKCSKGYRRVGNKCVLISYLNATKAKATKRKSVKAAV